MEQYDFESFFEEENRMNREMSYRLSNSQLRMWKRGDEEQFTIIADLSEWARSRGAKVLEIRCPQSNSVLDTVPLWS